MSRYLRNSQYISSRHLTHHRWIFPCKYLRAAVPQPYEKGLWTVTSLEQRLCIGLTPLVELVLMLSN